MPKSKLSIECEIALQREGIIATVFVSKSGGPVVGLITGREPHPTGRPVCVRAGFRGMPFESISSELPTIMLAEVASPINNFLVQPHRIDFRVLNSDRPVWSYRPDLKLIADIRFIRELAEHVPFAEAAARWVPQPHSAPDFRELIVEVKDDNDPRNGDEDYEAKLRLAAEAYARFGWHFVKIVRSRDLECGHIPDAVREIFLDALTTIHTTDVAAAIDAIQGRGVSATYRQVSEALGEGPLGRAKLAALHVRRVVSIDLSSPLSPESAVRLIHDGAAILKGN